MNTTYAYEQYFGLNEHPFSITPDPRFVYFSESHRAALEHLHYGVVGGGNGFVLLTGDVGTGKTTICRTFLEQLPPKTEVALILNPVLTLNEFLQTICDELNLVIEGNRESNKNLIDQLNQFLLQVYAIGHKTILIVDEAQSLTHELLEQIRLLTNLESDTDKLLQIFLIGQPELRNMLMREDLLQVSQRITSRFHLGPLNKNETRAYIERRLDVAGAQAIPFTASAIRRIYAFSKGVPRLINVLCDKGLLAAYETSAKQIDAKIIKDAERRVLGSRRSSQGGSRPFPLVAGGIVMLTAVLVAAGYLLYLTDLRPWIDSRPADTRGAEGLALPEATASREPRSMPADSPSESESPAGRELSATATMVPSGPGQTATDVAASPDQEAPEAATDVPGPSEVERVTAVGQAVSAPQEFEQIPSVPSEPESPADPELSATAIMKPNGPAQTAVDEVVLSGQTALEVPVAVLTPVEVERVAVVGQAVGAPQGHQPVPPPELPVGRDSRSAETVTPAQFGPMSTDRTLESYTRRSAEHKLLSMWGIDDRLPEGGDFCGSVTGYGLNCFSEGSGLAGLYRYDRPAIVQLTIGGAPSYAVVSKTSPSNVVLKVLDREHVIPAARLDDIWNGEFLLLWRKSGDIRVNFTRGAAGHSIVWLRDAMDQIEGGNSTGDVLDDQLLARVKRFQGEMGLDPDGIVGPRTLMVLQNKLAEAESSE